MYSPEAVSLLFYKSYMYIVYYNVIIVVCSLKSVCVPCFISIGCYVSQLHGHLRHV